MVQRRNDARAIPLNKRKDYYQYLCGKLIMALNLRSHALKRTFLHSTLSKGRPNQYGMPHVGAMDVIKHLKVVFPFIRSS